MKTYRKDLSIDKICMGSKRVFIKNKDLDYIYCNENYARDLGIDSDDVMDRNDYDFHPEELAEKYTKDDLFVLENKESIEVRERYFFSGEEVWIRTVKEPYLDRYGNIIGVLGVFEVVESIGFPKDFLSADFRCKNHNKSKNTGKFIWKRNIERVVISNEISEALDIKTQNMKNAADILLKSVHYKDSDIVLNAMKNLVQYNKNFSIFMRYQNHSSEVRTLFFLGWKSYDGRKYTDDIYGYFINFSDALLIKHLRSSCMFGQNGRNFSMFVLDEDFNIISTNNVFFNLVYMSYRENCLGRELHDFIDNPEEFVSFVGSFETIDDGLCIVHFQKEGEHLFDVLLLVSSLTAVDGMGKQFFCLILHVSFKGSGSKHSFMKNDLNAVYDSISACHSLLDRLKSEEPLWEALVPSERDYERSLEKPASFDSSESLLPNCDSLFFNHLCTMNILKSQSIAAMTEGNNELRKISSELGLFLFRFKEFAQNFNSMQSHSQEPSYIKMQRLVVPLLNELNTDATKKQSDLITAIADIVTTGNLQPQTLSEQLTSTEQNIAHFIHLGYSSKEIACLLNLSRRTIENYRQSIRSKLHILNTSVALKDELIKYYK